MILLEDALKKTKENIRILGFEDVPVSDSPGRILGEDICSGIEMPPFNKSAMDGYAVSSSDNREKYEIVEIIAAGKFPEKELKPGQCSKIMTGAPLPKGADRVIKVEVTEEKGNFMFIKGEDKSFNVCFRGEDIKRGDLILKKGTKIRPPETGIIASVGIPVIKVFKRPVVSVIATGSEIVEPGNKLEPGNIYNSNGYSVSAQVKSTGSLLNFSGIIKDDFNTIKNSISSLLETSDIVVISGGVSMGDYDFVPGIIKELGITIYFNKVAIQPGKPTLFGTGKGKVVFGLPGNPVSTFVIFEVFLRSFLYGMMGYEYSPVHMKGELKKDFKRKKTERDLFIPVLYEDGGLVDIVDYHGSAHLNSLGSANGLLKVPRGEKEILKGTVVNVRQF
ncbi:MAG: gephyrin-like molybdotransferase Glp [Acidobacteriota bacterium]